MLLIPQQPFFEWILSTEGSPFPELTLELLRENTSVFLLPEGMPNGHESAVAWIENRWRGLFEHMLAEWFVDESLWPSKRSLAMFREWFVIEYHPTVFDLASTPIEYEDWDNTEDDGDENNPCSLKTARLILGRTSSDFRHIK